MLALWWWDSGTVTASTTTVGSGKGRRRKPDYVLYEEPEQAPDLSEFEVKPVREDAIAKVLAQPLPSDSDAVKALRRELGKLRGYTPSAVRGEVKAIDWETAVRKRLEADDDDVIVLLLH